MDKSTSRPPDKKPNRWRSVKSILSVARGSKPLSNPAQDTGPSQSTSSSSITAVSNGEKSPPRKKSKPFLRGTSKSSSGVPSGNHSGIGKGALNTHPSKTPNNQDVTMSMPAGTVQDTNSSTGPARTETYHNEPIDVDSVAQVNLVPPVSGTNVFTTNLVTSLPEAMDIDQPTTNAASMSDAAAGRQAGGDHELKINQPPPQAFDLAKSIKGMYRILDLVTEQGSGGLVDKIIISQESLGRFINGALPGAYASMTKVDFQALDQLSIKPLGIYGSQREIVKFLLDIESIDEQVADTLRGDGSNQAGTGLRSGLYILGPRNSVLYVVYWPEPTTWNDDAISSVQRNRVTFMRYLTKICDQVIALVSDEDAQKIVWSNATEDSHTVDDRDEDEDRLFTFQVAKTNEQEENVSMKQGFSLELPKASISKNPEGDSIDPTVFVPSLVAGETVIGYMEAQYVPPREYKRPHRDTYTSGRLDHLLSKGSFVLSESLSEDALQILLRKRLGESRSPEARKALVQSREASKKVFQDILKEREDEEKARLEQEKPLLLLTLRYAISKAALAKFSAFAQETFYELSPEQTVDDLQRYLDQLVGIYPDIKGRLATASNDRSFLRITRKPTNTYVDKKEGIILAKRLLKETPDMAHEQKQELVKKIFEETSTDKSQSLYSQVFGSRSDQPFSQAKRKEAKTEASKIEDFDFLSQLDQLVADFPVLADAATATINQAREYFKELLDKKVDYVAPLTEHEQLEGFKRQVKAQIEIDQRRQEEESRRKFLVEVQKAYHDDNTTGGVLVVEDVRVNSSRVSGYWSSEESYILIGNSEEHTAAALKYQIRPFRLTEDDKHLLQMKSDYVPTPKLPSVSVISFHIPATHRLLYVQLLQEDRCLLVVEYQREVWIYLERPDTIDAALRSTQNSSFKKKLHREKIGNDFLLAFDESKRMLAVCATDMSSLNVFVFDETFHSLQALGSQVDLRSWYPDNLTLLTHTVFLCGASEELVLVDNHGHMRVYSLTTQQFRPGSIQLSSIPKSIHSSPDGSCLFTADVIDDTVHLRAYHWSNFGDTSGIDLELLDFPQGSGLMTSIGGRSKVHFVGIDVNESRCTSFVLDISRRVTEFTFQERGQRMSKERFSNSTVCNCLIDCHSDVWTRFPVVPAVRRTTANTVTEDNPRSIIFVSPLEPNLFQSHFSDLVANFERITRKPTEKELSSIVIIGITYEAFKASGNINVSTHKCGEWLVNLLCLIPIHIAVTKDNRFVPLKDGILSMDLERQLLGATVEHIVNSLSFGWYESIFQSYQASKPVRVVSSMGEQSVGKSFALNHLVDTSFAGSAMRTTEGVWMSVTPTDDSLIVALDFEGVHSIERSAQEDSLLVLFNTAMSNLVLFRNNFALSRDITGLFQSFQSSSTVLDPSANPTLFKSTLVIIIKDVVDSDKKEITKEFSLKFQKIVELEQGSNFITKLHNGSLAIVPWPVIESRQFYTLFPKLKAMLDKQPVTHPKGGIFLQTMKTLMAKLKVNDWGALDQNLSSHRAQQLMALLPRALMYGCTELEPEPEPLRDFDSGVTVDKPDSSARFYLVDTNAQAQPDQQGRSLASLVTTWDGLGRRFELNDRDWIEELGRFLDDLVDRRIDHVQEWLLVNTIRFNEAPQFQDVRRLFDTLVISLRSNIRICALQCAACQLLCLHPKHHEGDHNCQTDHQCTKSCQYVDYHVDGEESCGLPAGHQGTHICDISVHLCGQTCHLQDKGGCLGYCSKPVDHIDEEHTCPASHECGEPCSLMNIKLPGGQDFSCPEHCRKPSHEHHDMHLCETRSCPIRCQLCKRLCASPDHLHALDPDAVHLCGQDHQCSALCQSKGICQIETTPQSIEATFTGRHETFQYTKYTQAKSRLPCVIAIPAGELEHYGDHVHSLDKNVFHFCESRCEDCGYICTLPLGHNQQEHETSHGSMSRTRWAIDGQDGTVLEVNGRKFGATDDGAPMLCSMVCRNMNRHVHIDYCRSEDASACSGADIQHIATRMVPNPERAKDFTSHALHWRRTGFKDPYSQEEKTSFSKCDSMCSGPEHQGDAAGPAQPSYCNLNLFHQPLAAGQAAPGGIGYISRDGHHFSCRNPAQMIQAFHVIFVIDRSGSMGGTDRRPLQNTPVTARISSRHNNRVGAVYSSLHGFWQARASALNAAVGTGVPRRDAYSVILFDHHIYQSVTNDFTSSPDDLLNLVLPYGSGGGTDYTLAIKEAQSVMETNWSTERVPVVIFLSDGECSIADETVRDICRRSVALGRPLSFHAVAFGPSNATLRRMTEVARQVQAAVPADPMHPTVPSSYTEALDTIRLAETFLGLAESLRKPRGALMRGA